MLRGMLARLAVLLIAIPAIALAADAPPPGGKLAVVASARRSDATAGATPAGADLPPVTTSPAAPWLSPTPPVDAGECRMGCAQAYYFCRAGDQTSDCASSWSQCVAACDLPALGPAFSTAP